MAYADYTFYTTVYLGNVISQNDFPRLAERATEVINAIIGDKITDDVIADLDVYTNIKKANCALAEQIYYDNVSGGGISTANNISSISAGEETISYNTNKSAFSIQQDKYQTALNVLSTYLSNTNLLYMGID
jgi:hypothetical protein